MSFLDFLGFGNNKAKVEITENLIVAANLAKKELDSKSNFFKTFNNDDFCEEYAQELVQSFAYCDELMNSISNVLELNKNNFNTQPLTHLLFASVDDMFNNIGNSEAIKDFVSSKEFIFLPNENNIYAFLIAEKKVKKQLGVAEVNGQIQHDVMQEILYFDNKYFAGVIADNLDTLKDKLRSRFVFLMVNKFNEIIENLKQQKEDLHIQIELEKSKLLVNKNKKNNIAENTLLQTTIKELETTYNNISQQLTPEYQQQELHKFLQNNNTFMSKNDISLNINSLGVICDNVNNENTDKNKEIVSVNFQEFTLIDYINKVGFFVSINKKDVLNSIDKVSLLQNKSRYI